jgi:hypothetical protein
MIEAGAHALRLSGYANEFLDITAEQPVREVVEAALAAE